MSQFLTIKNVRSNQKLFQIIINKTNKKCVEYHLILPSDTSKITKPDVSLDNTS